MEEQITTTEKKSKLQSAMLAAAFLLCVSAIILGIFSGIKGAKDRATYQNAFSVYTALKSYYNDQGKYPTVVQYRDQKILVPTYLSQMPMAENATGICSAYKEFAYFQTRSNNFVLKFCLRKGAAGLDQGIHQFTESSLK